MAKLEKADVALSLEPSRKLGKANSNRKVMALVNGKGPDGNYIEYDDGERVSLTDDQWKAELTKMFGKERDGRQNMEPERTAAAV